MASKSLNLLSIFLSILMVAQLNEAQRGIPGGWTPADPKSREIIKWAKFAVTEANASLKYVAVLKAETQVVAGVNYRMVISAASATTGKTNNYLAIVWSPPPPNSPQLVSFKPLLRGSSPFPGGWTPITALQNPQVVNVGKFAVAEHNKEANASLEFVSISKGETQVVAGLNYRLVISAKDVKTGKIGKYQAIVWSPPGPTSSLHLLSFEQLLQRAPKAGGGWTRIENLNDPNIVNIAKFAVKQHNIDAKTSLELVKILQGYQQVVAGWNYRLVISAKDSKTGKVNNYEAIVWSKPWENNFLSLTSFKELLRNKRIVGGWTKIDNPSDNAEVVKVANFAITEHNKQAGSNLKYINIIKGEKQLVAGTNYRLVIVAKNSKTGITNDYLAVVFQNLGEKTVKLIKFEGKVG